jgi:hypothetical protein
MNKIIIFTLTLFLVACSSTMKMYSGPELPPSQTAVIRGADAGIDIIKCNGQKVTGSDIVVLPGDYTIEMSFQDRSAEVVSSDTSLMDFTAEAGHIYVVDKILNVGPGRYATLIIDKNTGNKVDRNSRSGRSIKASLDLSDRSIKEFPRDPAVWAERGSVLYSAGLNKDALAAYETALSLTPESNTQAREQLTKRINQIKERHFR